MITQTGGKSASVNKSAAYSEGKWDGKLGDRPRITQWQDKDYRQGWLDGVAEKYDSEYCEVLA